MIIFAIRWSYHLANLILFVLQSVTSEFGNKKPPSIFMAGGRFLYRLLVPGNGERDRIRTCDPVIKSHLLYQLSYAPELSFVKRQVTLVIG